MTNAEVVEHPEPCAMKIPGSLLAGLIGFAVMSNRLNLAGILAFMAVPRAAIVCDAASALFAVRGL